MTQPVADKYKTGSMLYAFNSLSFAVFMTAVFLIYWNIPAGYRYLVVLAANCYFYLGFGVRNFILLCIVCVATYLGAILWRSAMEA